MHNRSIIHPKWVPDKCVFFFFIIIKKEKKKKERKKRKNKELWERLGAMPSQKGPVKITMWGNYFRDLGVSDFRQWSEDSASFGFQTTCKQSPGYTGQRRLL